jgi:hypothetical protein
MKRKRGLVIYGTGVVLVAFVMVFAQGVSQAATPDVWANKTMMGEVVEVDMDSREIVLADALRNEITFAVDDKVKNLEEFAAGDSAVAEYYISLASDIRRPTEEEKETPFMELEESAELPPDCSFKAGLKKYRAVATVSGTDRFLQMIQFKGPRGNVFTVRATNPRWLGSGKDQQAEIMVGDTVVVTYSEPIITSLKK